MTDFNDIWDSIEASKTDGMTISEYKNYVLGFLFYRYLSFNQEQYLLKNNVLDINGKETINEAYLREAVDSDLDDYLDDISSSLGYAISPTDTWKSLITKINDDTLKAGDYQEIFDNFNKNAKLNKDATSYFDGIFDDVDIRNSRLGDSTTSKAMSLTKLVKMIDEFDFENSADNFHHLFEELIEQFANKSDKGGGEFYTPHSVSTLLSKLVTDGLAPSDKTFTGYDMASGSGSTLLALKDEVPGGTRPGAVKLYGTEKELTTYNLSRMNLLLGGMSYKNTKLLNHDTLSSDWPDGPDTNGTDHPRTFDAVVSDIKFSAEWDNSDSRMKDPRFNEYGKLAPKKTADYAFVLHGLYHLDEEGTMAMVLPHGILFRGNAAGTIRKNLIEHHSGNRVYAVIGLPENIMFSEPHKKSVAVTIVVFKKKRDTNDILFIDAKDDFAKGKNRNYLRDSDINKIVEAYHNRQNTDKYAHLASMEEIRKNEYNLNISRYVDTFEKEVPINLNQVNQSLEKYDKQISALQTEINKNLTLLGVKKDIK
ncbi:type I restriction-modification system subunit M [Oenococcus sp.]|uniref:type I restriction-modification system subunit M n=1 Tax=Oenococcus sp. TaxID=1979414 RepID=UPI0039ED8346